MQTSCHEPLNNGFLKVMAPKDGTYEIYRIAGQTSGMQLVAEQVGYFNKSVSLPAGNYLVLSDCSSARVVLNPNKTKVLIAHSLSFRPPAEITPDDRFLIQCTRYERNQVRQRLVNRFNLLVLAGARDLLVGMAPLKVDLAATDKPQHYEIKLSAVRVSEFSHMRGEPRFFVSPAKGQLSITQSQKLGNWLHLVKGLYDIELNGSRKRIELAEGERTQIDPAFIQVTTGKDVDLDLATSIEGGPLHLEINGRHWLSLNETYPILPGMTKLRLVGSEREHPFHLKSGDLLNKRVRSIRVQLDCPPWDWNCLGSRKIYLYAKEQHYPFATGVSDVPLLFFNDDAYLSIEGSRELRYQLSQKKNDVLLKASQIKLSPQVEYRPGLITDLVRIEAIAPPVFDHTYDIPLEHESSITLVEGHYSLAQYVTLTNTDGERRRSLRRFWVRPGHNQTLQFKVYVSEKKMLARKKERLAKVLRKRKQIHARKGVEFGHKLQIK